MLESPLPYQPFKVNQFEGLNLNDDPGTVGPFRAIDMSNVDIDRIGRLVTRDGMDNLGSSWTVVDPGVLHATAYDEDKFVVVYGDAALTVNFKVFDTGGSVVHTAGTANGQRASITRLGTFSGGSESTLLFVATGSVTMRRYNGTATANSTGNPWYLAEFPIQNRLVQARFNTAADSPSGANGSPSTVFFSDPGAPETYDASNFVRLRPGDGEVIQGMMTWGGQLFVFKQTAMYVFYGTQTEETGGSIFLYREVTLPEPLFSASFLGDQDIPMATGYHGAYYVTDTGIWRTTGDTPVRISDPVHGFFETYSPRLLSVVGDRVYLTAFGNEETVTLIYDVRLNVWLLWNFEVGVERVFAPWNETLFLVSQGISNSAQIFEFDGSTTDDGTAIDWHYQSGWYDLSGQEAEAFTRFTALRGSGSVTVSVFRDYGSTDSNAASVTLGTAPAIAEGRHNVSYRGTLWSHKVSGTGPATVSDLTHYIRNIRDPGRRAG